MNISNLFKITQQSNKNIFYKIAEVEFPEINEAMTNRNLNKVAIELSKQLSVPVISFKNNKKKYVAIADENVAFDVKYIGLAPQTAKITLINEIKTINVNAPINQYEKNLIKRLMEHSISRKLSINTFFWRESANQFTQRTPIHTSDEVSVYKSFSFKVVNTDNEFYLCLDISFRYISTKTVGEYIKEIGIDETNKLLNGKKGLFLYGDSWHDIAPNKVLETDILTYEVPKENKHYSLYYYVKEHAPNKTGILNNLSPQDLTLLYHRIGDKAKTPYSAPATLVKIIYGTEHNNSQNLHHFSIRKPHERLYEVQRIIKRNLISVTYKGFNFNISEEPKKEANLLKLNFPTLKFKNDRELNEAEFLSTPKKRKKLVTQNGILNQQDFDTTFLVVPDSNSLSFDFAILIRDELTERIRQLALNFEKLELICYTTTKPCAYSQFQEIKKAIEKNDFTYGTALIVLPDTEYSNKKFIDDLHDIVKKHFNGKLQIQCFSLKKISQFIGKNNNDEYFLREDIRHKFLSYVDNLIFEFLILNQKWLYSLKNSLNYDIYIGIDAHGNLAGFSYFFKTGETIVFDSEKTPIRTGSHRNEKIKSDVIAKNLLKVLQRNIPTFAPNPNGIIILRDGQSYEGEEEIALLKVIDALKSQGMIQNKDFKYAVVDIHKFSSIPLRLFNRQERMVINPEIGSVKVLDNENAFIFNTGYPFEIPGTAKPLHIQLKKHNGIDFNRVIKDIFDQTMLAFSAPDRPNSLPLPLKLIDTMIRPLANDITEESLEHKYEEIIEN